MDLRNQIQVLSLVKKITQERNIASIIIIHDLNMALRFCDRFLLLKDNRIFASGGREIMTEENIQAVYGLPVKVEELNGVPMVVPQLMEDV